MARHSAFRRSLLSLSLSSFFLYSSEDARKTGPSVRHGPRRDTTAKPGPNWASSFLSRYAPIIPIYLRWKTRPKLIETEIPSEILSLQFAHCHVARRRRGGRRRPSRLPSTKVEIPIAKSTAVVVRVNTLLHAQSPDTPYISAAVRSLARPLSLKISL